MSQDAMNEYFYLGLKSHKMKSWQWSSKFRLWLYLGLYGKVGFIKFSCSGLLVFLFSFPKSRIVKKGPSVLFPYWSVGIGKRTLGRTRAGLWVLPLRGCYTAGGHISSPLPRYCCLQNKHNTSEERITTDIYSFLWIYAHLAAVLRIGLGSAHPSLACSCFCSQLEGQLVAGCSRMASVGTTLFTSTFFSLHFSRLMGLVRTVVAGFQASWSIPGHLRPRLQTGMIFLMSRSHGQSKFQDLERDFRSSWKRLESHISNSVNIELGGNWDALAINWPQSTTNLEEVGMRGL